MIEPPPLDWSDTDLDNPDDREPDPDHGELWGARPELAHVRDYARARRVSPLATLGVALARVVAQTPPEVVLPPLVGDQASLNLFIALVGRSGQGKGGAEAAGMAALDIADPISPSGVGSGEGIPHLYVSIVKEWVETENPKDPDKPKRRQESRVKQHSTSALLSIPEVDTIGALVSRQGSTLAPELRKAWMGEALGFQYATLEKRLPVERHRYRMALIVGVQPARAGVLLDDVDGGTAQRYIWLPVVDPNAPDVEPPLPAGTWPWMVPDLNRIPRRQGRIELPVCDDARETIDASRVRALRGEIDPLDGHSLLTRLKVSAALALLAGHAGVRSSDWKLGELLMRISDATREGIRRELNRRADMEVDMAGRREARKAVVAEDLVYERGVARVARRVRILVRQAGDDGILRSAVNQAIAGRDKRYLDDALGALVRTGDILAEDIGKKATKLRVPQLGH